MCVYILIQTQFFNFKQVLLKSNNFKLIMIITQRFQKTELKCPKPQDKSETF